MSEAVDGAPAATPREAVSEARASAKEQLGFLWRMARTTLRPEPFTVYKPQKSGSGVVAKFNMRLDPVWEGDYVKQVDGGLFLDLVAQGPDKNGFPSFKWDDKASTVTAKLGLPDLSGLVVAIRDFRVRGLEVPTYLRGKPATAKPNTVVLFHKTDASSTVITYTFGDESSTIKLSKPGGVYKSVSLTLSEELILQQYLMLALDAFLRVGMR